MCQNSIYGNAIIWIDTQQKSSELFNEREIKLSPPRNGRQKFAIE